MSLAAINSNHAQAAAAQAPVLKALANQEFSKEVLFSALLLEDDAQEELFALARMRRKQCFPRNEVEVRSVVEISNVCVQQCEYCAISRPETPKYLMSEEEFLEISTRLYATGRRVLLLQAGENRSEAFVAHVCRCVREAKRRHADWTIILCLGNLSYDQYRQLREAGAERYVLKYETSNPRLYSRFKPRDTLAERLACLKDLLALGYQVGSGNIIELPGQSTDDLVEDLLFAGKYALSMVSCSAFIPGEGSALHGSPVGSAKVTLNTIALLRIIYPHTLIPTTSPLEKIMKDGQFLGLMAGANTVTIHDGTPDEIKHLFPIYSGRRFAPNAEHIQSIVKRAGLDLAKGPLL